MEFDVCCRNLQEKGDSCYDLVMSAFPSKYIWAAVFGAALIVLLPFFTEQYLSATTDARVQALGNIVGGVIGAFGAALAIMVAVRIQEHDADRFNRALTNELQDVVVDFYLARNIIILARTVHDDLTRPSPIKKHRLGYRWFQDIVIRRPSLYRAMAERSVVTDYSLIRDFLVVYDEIQEFSEFINEIKYKVGDDEIQKHDITAAHRRALEVDMTIWPILSKMAPHLFDREFRGEVTALLER
jgi:hypothetical protein